MSEACIKSHVQIPKFLLEGFCDKNNGYTVCRMNYVHNIDFELPKKCNTIENYYSNYIETDVLATLESDFGQVKKKILSVLKHKEQLILTEKEIDSIQWFFLFCQARQPHIANSFHSEEDTVWFFDGKTNRDAFIEFANIAKKQLYNELYSKFRFCISINRTSQNFIIPQNCVYYIFQSEKDDAPFMCVLPISPRIVINLVKLESSEQINKTICPIVYIDDLEQIDAFNSTAIYSEMMSAKDNNFKFLYAQTEQDFVRYNIEEIIKQDNK